MNVRSSLALRTLGCFTYLALVLHYVARRVFGLIEAPPHGGQLVWQLAFAVCELGLLSGSVRLLWLLRRSTSRSAQVDLALSRGGAPRGEPVAVLVPTCGEPIHVVEKCLLAARSSSVGVDIWVLDDGPNHAVRRLCADLGLRYVARADRSGGKAGNLNHALSLLRSSRPAAELFVVVDADFVVQPELVARAAALLDGPDVAIVQTPQLYYNRDPIQAAFGSGRAISDDLRFDFDVVDPALDAANSALCRGTSFVARLSAVEAVGGFPIDCVTEDLMLSHRLRAAGYRVLHLDEPLSFGLAAESFEQFQAQLLRWAAGYGQVARWRLSGVASPWGRWLTAQRQLRWAYSLPQQLFVLCVVPAAWSLLGLAPTQFSAAQLLSLGLPVFLTYRLYLTGLSRGRHLPLLREVSVLLQTLPVVRGATAGFLHPSQQTFRATRKGLVDGNWVAHWPTLSWLAAWLTLLGAAMWRSHDPWLTLWLGYALAAALLASLVPWQRPNARIEHRLPAAGQHLRIEGENGFAPAILLDASVAGLSLCTSTAGMRVNSPLRIAWSGVGVLDARVVRIDSSQRCAVVLATNVEQRRLLVARLFAESSVRPVRSGNLLQVFPAAVQRSVSLLSVAYRALGVRPASTHHRQ